MGIRKKRRVRGRGAPIGSTTEVTMPVVSYSSDGLAKLIIAAWADGAFNSGGVNVPKLGTALLDRDPQTGLPTKIAKDTAKEAFKTIAGLDLTRPIVISEPEHDDDYIMQDDDEVVFVLPNETRTTPINAVPNPIPPSLLETAKVLMACTPNGI